ncbi:MAG TPA: DUF4962 domain-containing protein [archaeon]|nr:DUF4962 domain-containing protein [archaeon]
MLIESGKIARTAACLFFAFASAALAAEHPRLYFSESDLPLLRSQAKGIKAVQFSRLSHWGDTHLQEAPPPDIDFQERHHEACFSAITNYGVLYQVTGESRYLETGKRWIEALLDLQSDGSGEFVMGHFSASLAHGYDLFYKGLSPDFRKRLKDKLIAVLEETRYGASNSWWGGIYTHHDFWIPVAFMGVAALSVAGEYPGADSIVGYSTRELERAMELLGDQGYWPEGVADWVYGMAPSLMFFEALKRSGGPDFYKYPWMRTTARARLMHWLPDDRYMYLGDSFPSGRYGVLGSVSAHLVMRLAALYRDSHAQWLALREAAVDSTAPPLNSLENPYSYGTAVPVTDRERHGLAWQFLWYDPTLKPVPPDTLPTDMLYQNWDTAIFRAGWKPEDPVLAFAGGHLLGRAGTAAWKAGNSKLPDGLAHTHQNAGAFYLWADGRFPITPPAFGGRDGRFHSTVMVNGHGQFFDAGYTGHITAFESGDSWAMAAMDLSRAYPPDVTLGEFTRTLIFLKPRTILIMDRLHGAGDNYLRRYEWLLQTDARSVQWIARDNSIAAVPLDDNDSGPWLTGRVFPSYRYYFEHQTLCSPEGKALNRALSVTILGRMPSRIQIAALLHAPAPGEDTGWLHRVECVPAEQAYTLVVPDGPYFIIPTGPQGKPTRSVVFAQEDSITIPRQVSERGLVLIVGLPRGQGYRLEPADRVRGIGKRLVPDPEGQYRSSEAGNLVLRSNR